MKAIIAGSMIYESEMFYGFEEISIDTAEGWVSVLINKKKEVIFLQRHGKKKNIPPHKINHKANILALKSIGVTKIYSFSSTGSLNLELGPGSVVVPRDYIDLWSCTNLYDDRILHVTPQISEKLRQDLIHAASGAGIEVYDAGVYIQTRGPRLETKSEISMLKQFADIVGMTFGSECTIANEIGIPIANISSVDNYANGLVEGSDGISEEQIDRARRENFKNVEKILKELIG